MAKLVRHRFLIPGIKGSSPFIPTKKIAQLVEQQSPKLKVMGSTPLFLEIFKTRVVKLVDTLGLGSNIVRCKGSSPFSGKSIKNIRIN